MIMHIALYLGHRLLKSATPYGYRTEEGEASVTVNYSTVVTRALIRLSVVPN